MRKFDVGNLESVLLLINFSEELVRRMYYKFSLCVINTLLKTFEENLLLDSENALHLWAHMLHIKFSCDTNHELFKGITEKLKMMKPILLLRHYQSYVEGQG